MTVAADLTYSAIGALDAKTSDDSVTGLHLAAVMRFYVLGRLSSAAAGEVTGNGRAELLDRLAEFGVNSFEQIPEGLARERAPGRFLRG
jgi:hypothetical protein